MSVVRMSRAAWDGLPPELKRTKGGHRFVVDPETGGAPIRVRLLDPQAVADAVRRPTVAEVAALLSALTRELS